VLPPLVDAVKEHDCEYPTLPSIRARSVASEHNYDTRRFIKAARFLACSRWANCFMNTLSDTPGRNARPQPTWRRGSSAHWIIGVIISCQRSRTTTWKSFTVISVGFAESIRRIAPYNSYERYSIRAAVGSCFSRTTPPPVSLCFRRKHER